MNVIPRIRCGHRRCMHTVTTSTACFSANLHCHLPKSKCTRGRHLGPLHEKPPSTLPPPLSLANGLIVLFKISNLAFWGNHIKNTLLIHTSIYNVQRGDGKPVVLPFYIVLHCSTKVGRGDMSYVQVGWG